MLTPLLLLGLHGCTGPTEPEPDDTGEAPLAHVFSFALIADPHIAGPAEHEERLVAAVQWINDNAEARKIEVVPILGDVGWGDRLQTSRDLLDGLNMHYLPVLGDNEVHFDTGEPFNTVFEQRITELDGAFDSYRRGPVEIHNPVHDKTAWMQNFTVEHRGVTFMALDWVSRHPHDLLSELAELHDFDGGTFPWFEQELTDVAESPAEDILFFSHHAMHLSPFDLEALGKITGITGPIGGRIGGAWAGHYHFNYEERIHEGGYDVWVTDATWDDENTVRVVEVWGNGERFEYVQELVVVP